MTKVLLALALLLPSLAQAQTCTPTYPAMPFWRGATGDLTHVYGDFTPDDKVRMVLYAGIGTASYSGPPLEFKMEVEVAAYNQDGTYAGTTLTPMWVNQSLIAGTPMLALPPGRYLLLPKWRLTGRVNSGPPAAVVMNLFILYLEYPLACLPRLLGVETPQVGSNTSPDFTALVAAATEAAAKLTALAGSVPP